MAETKDTISQGRLRYLLEAEQAVLKSQKWKDGTVENQRAEYQQIAAEIKQLRSAGVKLPEEIEVETAARPRNSRVRRVVFIE